MNFTTACLTWGGWGVDGGDVQEVYINVYLTLYDMYDDTLA